MGKSEYCMPCGEKGNPVFATEVVDDEPMCRGCAGVAEKERRRREEALAAREPVPVVEMTPEIDFEVVRKPVSLLPVVQKPRRVKREKELKACSRGCGQFTHRGHCPRVEPAETLSEVDKTKLGEVITDHRNDWAQSLLVSPPEKDVQTIGMRMEQRLTPQMEDSPLDCLVTPTTGLAGSEHSRIDGERTPEEAPEGTGPANAEAVAKNAIDPTRQEAERQGSQVVDSPEIETVAGLKAQRVTFKDIPALVVFRKPRGRIVSVWDQLLGCPADSPVLRLECESIRKAGQLALHLRGRAKKLNREIDSRRDDNVLYVWLVEMEKSA